MAAEGCLCWTCLRYDTDNLSWRNMRETLKEHQRVVNNLRDGQFSLEIGNRRREAVMATRKKHG